VNTEIKNNDMCLVIVIICKYKPRAYYMY